MDRKATGPIVATEKCEREQYSAHVWHGGERKKKDARTLKKEENGKGSLRNTCEAPVSGGEMHFMKITNGETVCQRQVLEYIVGKERSFVFRCGT